MANTVSALTLDQIIQAWRARQGIQSPDAKAFAKAIYASLVAGRPASAQAVAQASGIPLDVIEYSFAAMKNNGAEFDAAGNLVGNALTLNPTPHHFRVGGQPLYAWCSLDTLFLPGLIGQTARVQSTCPVTGERISLTVSGAGVTDLAPSTAVSSIVVPGMTANCACGPGQTGPESAVCGQMHFFADRQAAETWLQAHPDVTVLTVADAFELARAVWLQPQAPLPPADNLQIQIFAADAGASCGPDCC